MNKGFLLVGFTLALTTSACTSLNRVDISGDWTINSSVGGEIPIVVYCTIAQQGQALSGTCTPEMENPESSQLAGMVDGTSANWAYSVVFNGNPGTVEFQAQKISDSTMEGTLILSGTPAPFTAVRQ